MQAHSGTSSGVRFLAGAFLVYAAFSAWVAQGNYFASPMLAQALLYAAVAFVLWRSPGWGAHLALGVAASGTMIDFVALDLIDWNALDVFDTAYQASLLLVSLRLLARRNRVPAADVGDLERRGRWTFALVAASLPFLALIELGHTAWGHCFLMFPPETTLESGLKVVGPTVAVGILALLARGRTLGYLVLVASAMAAGIATIFDRAEGFHVETLMDGTILSQGPEFGCLMAAGACITLTAACVPLAGPTWRYLRR